MRQDCFLSRRILKIFISALIRIGADVSEVFDDDDDDDDDDAIILEIRR